MKQTNISITSNRTANINPVVNRSIEDNQLTKIFKTFIPVTLPYTDNEKRQIQLWKSERFGLIGTVLDKDVKIKFINQNRIHSLIGSKLSGSSLLERLEKSSITQWDFVYRLQTEELFIFPHLIAAARFSLIDTKKVKTSQDVYVPNRLLPTRHERTNRPIPDTNASDTSHTQLGMKYSKERNTYYSSAFEFNEKNELIREIHFTDHDRHDHLNPHQHIWRENPSKGTRIMEKKGGSRVEGWHYSQKEEIVAKNVDKLAQKQFAQNLGQQGLVKSFNSNHPNSSLSNQGQTGETGGVECSVELIEGLFDHPESLFDQEHAFFIPQMFQEPLPFSNQELAQILRELAIGIYVHDTVPFFSLHFNAQANLYPIIHPAYANTLVGQVFSMLDYQMKGYLNGGVFEESFIKEWQKNPYKITNSSHVSKDLINFGTYAATHLQGSDRHYFSVRQILKQTEESGLEKLSRKLENVIHETIDQQHVSENPVLRDYTRFTNSFRIIAHQNQIQKTEGLFVLDWDFDVLYTVTPDPEYQLALDEYLKIHGTYPPAYSRLITAYELMKKQIHDHMFKLPMCQKYFSMLGVINFFSYYFTTLKKHHKMPVLPQVDLKPASCPRLFPSLPILTSREEALKLNWNSVMQTFIQTCHSSLSNYFTANQPLPKEQLKQIFNQKVFDYSYLHASPPLKNEMKEGQTFVLFAQKLAEQFNIIKVLESVKSQFNDLMPTINKQLYELNQKRDNPNYRIQWDKLEEMNLKVGNKGFYFDTWGAVQKSLPTMVPNKTNSIPIPITQFLLSSEQTSEEIEHGKKIVGGCGMKTEPMRIQPSFIGNAVLEQSWSSLQKAEIGEFVTVSNKELTGVSGAVFRLAFEDIPKGWSAETLFLPEYSVVNTMASYIIAGKRKKFLKLLQEHQVEKMRDHEGRTLLHHAAMQKDLFYTETLLKKIKSTIPDQHGYLPVHYAAMGGHIAQLKLFQLSLEATSLQGATPLVVAIQHGQKEAVEFLLSYGAKDTTILTSGYTPLHCAAHGNDVSIALLLLKRSKNLKQIVNHTTNEGVTPLMLVTDPFLAIALIKSGANPKLKAKNGMTALDLAVKKNNLPLFQCLFPHSDISATTIEIAIKKGSLEINQALTTRPGYLNYQNAIKDTPLLMSLRYANTPLTKYFLDKSLDVQTLNASNKLKETPIELAARGGFYDILWTLLQKGAQVDPVTLCGFLLKGGYQGDHPSLQEHLKKHKFSQNDLKQLVLTAAKAGNYMAITRLLLPLNAPLQFVTSQGWRLEHYLAKSDGIFLFKKCYSKETDWRLPLSHEGEKTVAYIAGERANLRVLEFLLEQYKIKQIPLDNHYLQRHLFYSVLSSGSKEGVELFLKKEPTCVNQVLDPLGSRPVHVGAQGNSKDILVYLHSQGADLTLVNQEGYDALYYAIRAENKEGVSFLLEQKVPISNKSLLAAASLSKEECFLTLLKAGADLEVSKRENTAFMLAIHSHDLQAFSRLMTHGASLTCINQEGWTPLLLIAKTGQYDMLQMLCPRLPKMALRAKKEGNNALHIACQYKQSECIAYLVHHGFSPTEPNENKQTPVDLTNKSLGPLASLGSKQHKEMYESYLKKLQQTVQNQSVTDILKEVKQWPINTYFSIERMGHTFKGTVLHLVLLLCRDCQELSELVEEMVQRKGFNPSLKDGKGRSYAHLMVEAKLDPTKIDLFSLEESDRVGKTPLHVAAAGDSTLCLNALIKKLGPMKLNLCDQTGRTPVFYAIESNKKDNLAMLLKSKVDVNRQDIHGITPLTLAIAQKNEPIVRMLIKGGADLNPPPSALHPLMVSLEIKNESIALLLLFQGAKTNVTSSDKASISHIAASRGKTNILRFLMARGEGLETYDDKGRHPIHHAALGGRIKTLTYLHSEGMSLETPMLDIGKMSEFSSMTPLCLATMRSSPSTVKWLLDRDVNPNVSGNGPNILETSLLNTPGNSRELLKIFSEYLLTNDLKQLLPAIGTAIRQDTVDSLKILYGLGIPLHGEILQGLTGLHLACQFGALAVTEFLLRQNVPLNPIAKSGETPIELAAANKSPEQFRLMLKSLEPDLDQRYQRGETLLHIAVRAGNLAHTAILIDEGADFDLADVQGQTPLFLAAEKGFEEIAELLMICGANSKISTTFNQSLPEDIASEKVKEIILKYKKIPLGGNRLHVAATTNNRLAVILTARHFDVNEKDSHGDTPLHLATRGGFLNTIREILNYGGDMQLKNNMLRTPLEVACLESKNPAVIQLLQSAGEKK